LKWIRRNRHVAAQLAEFGNDGSGDWAASSTVGRGECGTSWQTRRRRVSKSLFFLRDNAVSIVSHVSMDCFTDGMVAAHQKAAVIRIANDNFARFPTVIKKMEIRSRAQSQFQVSG